MGAKTLAARLNPKNIDVLPIPSSKESITGLDVAGSLGMDHVSQGASLIIRIKWSGQEQHSLLMAIVLYKSLSDQFNYSKWSSRPTHRPGLILDLCKLAVYEFTQCPTCVTCQGTKIKPEVVDEIPTGKFIICPTCGGYGTKPKSRGELVREHLRLDKSTFDKNWSQIYKKAIELLGKYESEGLYAINTRLLDSSAG